MQPIGPYRPDMAASNAGVTANVSNVLMFRDETGVAYGPHPSLAIPAGAGALPATPLGGTTVVLQSGAKKVFVGTAATIEEMANDFTWTARGTGYTVPSGDKWSMTQFGAFLLATNTTDGLLAYNAETPAGVNAVSGAPAFKSIFVAFDCLFGCVSDDDALLFRNSAPNDHTNWTTAGAGYQPLADGEGLMGGGEISQGYAIVLQRKAVHLLQRTGDRKIYNRVKLSSGEGSVNPWGIVNARGAVYFCDTDGFKRATSSGVEAIGQEKVNRYFVDHLAGSLDGIEGAFDAANQRIVWRHQEQAASSTTLFPTMMTFDLRLGEFVPIETETTAIFSMASPGYTADNASGLGTTDTAPYGPDSRFWVGGEEGLLGINSAFKAGFFNGASLAAEVETATLVSPTNNTTTRATVITDSSSATLSMGARTRLSDNATYTTAQSMTVGGSTPVRATGKLMSAKVNVAAGEDWSFIRGVRFDEIAEGGAR
tara:strand:+ start:5089 stop:6537 length:1449 start_codon:yes stop_codon:yes gene_type:complete